VVVQGVPKRMIEILEFDSIAEFNKYCEKDSLYLQNMATDVKIGFANGELKKIYLIIKDNMSD
jgi:hypothetical protein